MARRTDAAGFTDHWTWRPEWTPSRPRLLWYLTFEHAPHVASAAAPWAAGLAGCGVDVVPPRWLHLTVSDVGFVDEIDDVSLAAATESVRHALRDEPPMQLELSHVEALPGAVVLAAEPVEQLRRIRTLVRDAMSGVGLSPPDDLTGPFRPHVSLAYVNKGSDHARLLAAFETARDQEFGIEVPCDRVAQVLVTRDRGQYRWAVLDQARLRGGSRRPGTVTVQRSR